MATATRPSNNPPVTKPALSPVTKAVAEAGAEKEHKKKPKHPLIGAKEGYPFKAVPADWDHEKHQTLKKKDFADEAGFFEFRAVLCDNQAARFRSKAVEARTIGAGGEDKKEIKKLLKAAERLKELEAILAKKGHKVADIIAAANKAVEAAAAPVAA